MTNSRALRRRILGGTLVGLVAATTLTVAAPASGAPDRKDFSATISPTTAIAGQQVAFAVTVKNSSRSNNDLGSVQLVVPSGFTEVQLNTAATTPSGWQASFPSSCTPGQPLGCGAPGSTLVQVSTPASMGAQKIPAGGSLTFTVSAVAPTPSQATSYPWNVAAKNSASWSDGQLFTLTGSQPSVSVAAPSPTKLAFTSQPPAGVTAGQTFGVSVALQTTDGQPTNSTSTVMLSGVGATLSGTVSKAAVNGTATFSGLSLTKAGTFTLRATSPTLTDATSASIVVSAGTPSSLQYISEPTSTLLAGGIVTTSVSVQDDFGNQTGSPTLTLTVTSTGSGSPVSTTTAAAVAGVATLTSDPITGAGDYSVTVSGPGLDLVSGLSVAAAAPSQLVFVSAPASTSTAGASYPVTVAIRDEFGNATTSTASVVLSIGSTQQTVDAVNGTAAFTGAAPTAVGTYSVSASSGELSSPTVSLSVTSGAAAALVVTTAPTEPVGAGQPISVGVEARDAFGNPVDSANMVSVTLAVTGGIGSASQTDSTGRVTLGGTAASAVGASLITISSPGLPSVTQSLTVVAGPAAALQIVSLIDRTTGFVADPVSLQYPLVPVDIVIEGLPFDITVRSVDQFGNESPVSVTAALHLSEVSGDGALGGTLTGSITAGSSSGTILGATYSPYTNGVLLRVSSAGLASADVLVDVQVIGWVQDATPGTATTVVNPACVNATPQVPVCGSLLLPNGANGKVLLSQGACNPIVPAALGGCLSGVTPEDPDALLVNAKAKLERPDGTKLYTRAKPATMVLKCDKTLCGGGGVSTFPIVFDLDFDNVGFGTAPFCPSKGRLGSLQTYCFDSTQSKRDNAGDLVAYVLFFDDARGSFKG